MLSYQLLDNHAGMVLTGDYSSLSSLHWVIHDVNDESPLLRPRKSKSQFLGLAYDVRKALEGERITIEPDEGFEETGNHFGVGILWPHILLQSRILRTALGYMPSNSIHQAMTFSLEYAIESALQKDFGKKAERIITRWKSINPANPFVEQVFLSRGHLFCEWTASERQTKMDALLATFDSLHDFDRGMAVRSQGQHAAFIDPKEFEGRNGDWPDPRAGDRHQPMFEIRIRPIETTSPDTR